MQALPCIPEKLSLLFVKISTQHQPDFCFPENSDLEINLAGVSKCNLCVILLHGFVAIFLFCFVFLQWLECGGA